MNRRQMMLSALAAGGLGTASAVQGQTLSQSNYRIPRHLMPRQIEVDESFVPGTIYAYNEQRMLYWITEPGRAIRYAIAIGAEGREFRGTAHVARKAEWPSWRPTATMVRLEPAVYGPYRSGLPGGHPRNPLGARALYLYRGGRDTLYRIHGTPQPWTLGRSFSSGCLRLANEHIEDLYDRVPVGTPVVVV
ncbi:L,D-transpeptidase [Oceanicola granulosus]|nr:L,D-transpeptidase [Oceanicola granulosus]